METNAEGLTVANPSSPGIWSVLAVFLTGLYFFCTISMPTFKGPKLFSRPVDLDPLSKFFCYVVAAIVSVVLTIVVIPLIGRSQVLSIPGTYRLHLGWTCAILAVILLLDAAMLSMNYDAENNWVGSKAVYVVYAVCGDLIPLMTGWFFFSMAMAETLTVSLPPHLITMVPGITLLTHALGMALVTVFSLFVDIGGTTGGLNKSGTSAATLVSTAGVAAIISAAWFASEWFIKAKGRGATPSGRKETMDVRAPAHGE